MYDDDDDDKGFIMRPFQVRPAHQCRLYTYLHTTLFYVVDKAINIFIFTKKHSFGVGSVWLKATILRVWKSMYIKERHFCITFFNFNFNILCTNAKC